MSEGTPDQRYLAWRLAALGPGAVVMPPNKTVYRHAVCHAANRCRCSPHRYGNQAYESLNPAWKKLEGPYRQFCICLRALGDYAAERLLKDSQPFRKQPFDSQPFDATSQACIDCRKIEQVHLSPTTRRIFQQSYRTAARSNWRELTKSVFQFESGRICDFCISMRDSQMRNYACVCSPICAKYGEAFDKRGRQGDEWFRRIRGKIGRDRKSPNARQRKLECFYGTQYGLCLAKYVGRNFVRRQEGKENGDMRWNAQGGACVKTTSQFCYCRLGCGNLNDECRRGHGETLFA